MASQQQRDLERLQQMERDLERSQFQAQPQPQGAAPVISPTSEPQQWGWGKTISLVAGVGLGLMVLGWILNLVGLVIKLGLLVGAGYLIYRFIKAINK